jgi:general L-amino acid transport system substrate-binding protein
VDYIHCTYNGCFGNPLGFSFSSRCINIILCDIGSSTGLDVEYCKAIAAAIGLNAATDITYVYASGSERFNLLRDGEIDVLIRTTTWTTSRDADLNADFGGINFFDGQAILVNGDKLANDGTPSIYDLAGATICVATGTTTEGNIQDLISDWDSAWGATPSAVVSDDATAARAAFTGGSCDAYTGDNSAMAAYKWQLDGEGGAQECAMKTADDATVCTDLWIAAEYISKEPLTSAVRDYDTEWKEVVQWVWHGMVTAEEMGLHSGNYAAADMTNPSVDRLLNNNLGLGTDTNPLPATWMQNVLSAVGNYGEAWDDSFCDGTWDAGVGGSDTMSNCVLSRVGTANALVSEGGLQFAPPMR